MPLNSIIKTKTPTLLLPLDEKDQFQIKCSPCKQLGSSTRSSEDGSLIIRHPTAVQVSIASCKREWVRVPPVSWGGDDIVMAEHREKSEKDEQKRQM